MYTVVHSPRQRSRLVVGVLGLVASLVLASLAFGTVPVQAASIIYVDADATGADNGSSWNDAFTKLQDALAAAAAGNEIWVAQGIYTLAKTESPAATFLLKSGVALYGGFAGGETKREQRGTRISELSGRTNYNCRIVTAINITDAILDGFEINGGYGYSPIIDRAPVVREGCDGRGGGILADKSTLKLTNVFITGNGAFRGGGIYSDNSILTLENVTVLQNIAVRGGNGIYSVSSTLSLFKSEINSNSEPSPRENTTKIASEGGGIYSDDSTLRLISSRITNNSATGGGGIYTTKSNFVIADTVIGVNSASGNGGAILGTGNNDVTLTNVTLVGNTAARIAGIIVDAGSLLIQNSLVAYNDLKSVNGVPPVEPLIERTGETSVTVRDSLVFGGFPGGTNIIDAPPSFAYEPYAPFGNFKLTRESVAIDQGDNNADLDSDGPETQTIADIVPIADGNGDGIATIDLGADEVAPPILYVDIKASGEATGFSWTNAFTDLQTAIEAGRTNGAEIWVAAGTYRPEASLLLRAGIHAYGGFSGNETRRDQRDWRTNKTILSGDRNGDDGPNFANYDDNIGPVVTGIADDATLDGFTIRGGNHRRDRDDERDDPSGGGISVTTASPILANLVVTENKAEGQGGGIGIYPEFYYEEYESNPTLTNIVVVGNYSSGGNHGVYSYRSNPVLVNVAIVSNQSNEVVSDNPTLNCGGIFIDKGTLTNVTIANNTGYAVCGESTTVVQNSVLWDNNSNGNGQILVQLDDEGNDNPIVRNSLVQGGYAAGSNIIDANPQFVDAAAGNYQLRAGSLAINVGVNTYLPTDVGDLDGDGNTSERTPLDLGGKQRIVGSTVDLGAYEFQGADATPTPTMPPTLTPTATSVPTTTPIPTNVPDPTNVPNPTNVPTPATGPEQTNQIYLPYMQ